MLVQMQMKCKYFLKSFLFFFFFCFLSFLGSSLLFLYSGLYFRHGNALIRVLLNLLDVRLKDVLHDSGINESDNTRSNTGTMTNKPIPITAANTIIITKVQPNFCKDSTKENLMVFLMGLANLDCTGKINCNVIRYTQRITRIKNTKIPSF